MENIVNKKEELEFIELCSDTTFKYLYKNPKTRPWFDNIIKSKFGLDLKEYKLVDNELNSGNNKKDYRLDINLDNDDKYVIIEMNNDYYKFVFNKSYQYLYRLAGGMYKEGEDYKDKKAKLILFNNFKNKKIPDMKTGNFILEDPVNKIVIEDIESYEIYLPNFSKVCYHNVNSEDISLSLFTCKSYEEMREKTNNPKDLEIIEELERLAMNKDFIFDYHRDYDDKLMLNAARDDGYAQGMDEGYAEGFDNGSDQKAIEIANNMLSKGIDIKTISECTNLDIEEIEKLK